jgi:DNA-binding NarL/FixJ family response regulator
MVFGDLFSVETTGPGGTLHHLRVLLVEDDPADAALVDAILRDVPELELVAVAETGRDAIAALQAEPFDAIVLDLGLPDSTGPSTFLTVLSAAPDAAIVVVTGNEDEGLERELLRWGAQEFFPKTLLVKAKSLGGELLARSVRSAVHRHAVQRGASSQARNLSKIVEEYPAAMVVVGLDGEVLLANQEACRVLGAERDALVGEPFPHQLASEPVESGLEIVHDGDRELEFRFRSTVWRGQEAHIAFVRDVPAADA